MKKKTPKKSRGPVVLLNSEGPGFQALFAETCCFGLSSGTPSLNSTLVGLGSVLLDAGREIKWASSLQDIPDDAQTIVTPAVIGYLPFVQSIMQWVPQHIKKLAFAIPPGLKGTDDRLDEIFDFTAGYYPIPLLARALGVEGTEAFPEFRADALPPKPFIPTILCAEGCWASCMECSWASKAMKPMRWRAASNTIASLEAMYDGSSKVVRNLPVYILVAEVDANIRWLREFVKLKQDRLPNLKWVTDVRADKVTEEIVELLTYSGCVEVIASIESCDQAIIDSIGRHCNLEEWVRGYKLLKAARIRCSVPMLWGIDPREDPDASAEWIRKQEVDPTDLKIGDQGVVGIYNGTPMWDLAQAGKIPTEKRMVFPAPAEPLLVRQGADEAIAKARRFRELLGV